jgi:membrane protein DedA with SNARE-associated domain
MTISGHILLLEMLNFFSELAQTALASINQGSAAALLALFFISALTEIGIPFPFILDTVLILTGLETGILSLNVLFIVLSLFGGRFVGASAIYWLTRIIGGAFVAWISRRSTFLQKRLDWLAVKLIRRAPLAVALTRLTPGLLTPSTVAAGVIPLRYWHLISGIAISSIIADGSLLVLGFTTGKGLEQFGFSPHLWMIVVIVIIVAGIGWFVGRLLSRRAPKQ